MFLFVCFLLTGHTNLKGHFLRLSGLTRKTIFSGFLFQSHLASNFISNCFRATVNFSNSSRTFLLDFLYFHSFMLTGWSILSWGHPYLWQPQLILANILLTILLFQCTSPRTANWSGIWSASQYGRLYSLTTCVVSMLYELPYFQPSISISLNSDTKLLPLPCIFNFYDGHSPLMNKLK